MSQKSKSRTSSSKIGVTPLADRVVVEPLTEDDNQTTASGIIIPDTVDKDRPNTGKVVAVGPGKYNEDGDELIPMSVKVGQKVLFTKYGPDEFTVGDKEYYVVSESNILAVID